MERKMVTYEDIFVFVYTEGGGRREVGGFWCVTMKFTPELAVNW